MEMLFVATIANQENSSFLTQKYSLSKTRLSINLLDIMFFIPF